MTMRESKYEVKYEGREAVLVADVEIFDGPATNDPAQCYTHRREMKHVTVGLWFNGRPLQIVVADSPDYFHAMPDWGKPGKTYQIWGKSVMLTAAGDGEAAYPKIDAGSLRIETPLGDFRVRALHDGDKRVYGCNFYEGLYMEPLAAENAPNGRETTGIDK